MRNDNINRKYLLDIRLELLLSFDLFYCNTVCYKNFFRKG